MNLSTSKQSDESTSEQSDESVSEQSGEPVVSARRAAGPRRVSARFRRAGLVAVTLLGIVVLAAACGLAPKFNLVVGHAHHPLAFVNCLRTHGEPNLPDPVVEGNRVRITITPGSGVNPRSAQFTAAFKACRYLTSPGGRTGS